MYTALTADQSRNHAELYDVNQFPDAPSLLLHWEHQSDFDRKRENANKPLCQKTLEDGCRIAPHLRRNVAAPLGGDDLGLISEAFAES